METLAVNVDLITGWFPSTVVIVAIVSVVLSVGWHDGAWNRQLVIEIPATGMQLCLYTPDGDHSFQFWAAAFKTSLPWLSWRLGLTPTPKDLPATCDPPIP